MRGRREKEVRRGKEWRGQESRRKEEQRGGAKERGKQRRQKKRRTETRGEMRVENRRLLSITSQVGGWFPMEGGV